MAGLSYRDITIQNPMSPLIWYLGSDAGFAFLDAMRSNFRALRERAICPVDYIRGQARMKKVYRILFILHAFVGIGGMAGGLAAILNPQSPMGITVDALKYSPFSSFLVPGILLFGVIGLGNVLCAAILLLKSRFKGYTSSVTGWALVIWIIVQCIMLRAVNYLHVIFFVIGLVQAVLSMSILFHERLFPANVALSILDKLESKFPDNFIIKNVVKLEKRFYAA